MGINSQEITFIFKLVHLREKQFYISVKIRDGLVKQNFSDVSYTQFSKTLWVQYSLEIPVSLSLCLSDFILYKQIQDNHKKVKKNRVFSC